MESPTAVVSGQQKRKRGPNKAKAPKAQSSEQPATKKTRQTTKWKSPLLKIYNENVVSVDEIKDLGSISYVPMAHNTTKQRLTISFKYKRHDPIVICVDQDDLKSVTKKVRDYARKYGTTLDEGEVMEEGDHDNHDQSDDEKEDKGKQLELEMQMYENGDIGEETSGSIEPKPAPASATTKPKPPKAKLTRNIESNVASGPNRKPKPLALAPDDDEIDDVFNDSDTSSDESTQLHSPEPSHS